MLMVRSNVTINVLVILLTISILACLFSKVRNTGEYANSILPRCGIESAPNDCQNLKVRGM